MIGKIACVALIALTAIAAAWLYVLVEIEVWREHNGQ